MLTILAPAKLNLTLEVLAKRPDGFHEILSIIQTINLCDRLCFRLSEKMVFRCDDTVWLAEKSLVSRAASLLKETTGYPKGAIIELSKKIPLLSGLAGDSSDAAVVLRGLNELWGLAFPLGELAQLASQLGSDVPFFLFGGTALVQGRGELISPLPSLPHTWVVLLMPSVPKLIGKTGRLYASLKTSHYTEGQMTEKLVASLTRGEEVAPARLFNVFENVAFDSFAGLKDHRKQFLQAGASSVHLAGSGPALFTLIRNKAQAEKIYGNLQQLGLESCLTDTLVTIEQVE